MSKWINAAQAITRKSGGGGSAESARSRVEAAKTAESGLYALSAPPTLTDSEVVAPEIERAVELLRERPDDVRAVVGRPQSGGRCLVAVAIRNADGSIEARLLDALIDPFELLERIERDGLTIH